MVLTVRPSLPGSALPHPHTACLRTGPSGKVLQSRPGQPESAQKDAALARRVAVTEPQVQLNLRAKQPQQLQLQQQQQQSPGRLLAAGRASLVCSCCSASPRAHARVCVCVCVHKCLHVCVHVHVHSMCACACAHARAQHVCACAHVLACECTFAHVLACACVCTGGRECVSHMPDHHTHTGLPLSHTQHKLGWDSLPLAATEVAASPNCRRTPAARGACPSRGCAAPTTLRPPPSTTGHRTWTCCAIATAASS